MLLYNSAICDLLRESTQMMKWILLGNFSLSVSNGHRKFLFFAFCEFFSMGKVLQIAEKFTKRETKFFCGRSKPTTDILIFFTKVCFYFKKIVKNTKKSEKIKWHQKLAVHHIILQGIYFGGVWSFVDISKKYILPKLFFWELSAGQGRGERMGLPWKI